MNGPSVGKKWAARMNEESVGDLFPHSAGMPAAGSPPPPFPLLYVFLSLLLFKITPEPQQAEKKPAHEFSMTARD